MKIKTQCQPLNTRFVYDIRRERFIESQAMMYRAKDPISDEWIGWSMIKTGERVVDVENPHA